MNTLIVSDIRIYKVDDEFYASDAFSKVLERYSKKFLNIALLSRIIDSQIVPKGYSQITKLCKKFVNIGTLKNAIFINRKEEIINLVNNSDFIILRMPSFVNIFIYDLIKKYNKVYMTEVMGCAWDAYWNHGLLGKLIAPFCFLNMKKICYNANYSLYVTERFLQKRYPCKNKSVGVSNVNIAFSGKPKDFSKLTKNGIINMMTAASVDVKFKGQKYVIKALKELKRKGIVINYYLAGGGNKNFLSHLAKKEKVDNQVIFLGLLSHDKLLEEMNKMDFYIQPSLQEGLPRSVIEAMSCGCVCFGSTTAGIPELLEKEQIFKRKSVNDIVRIIENNLKENLNVISKSNVEKSKKYLNEKLDKTRNEFYDKIINDIGVDKI